MIFQDPQASLNGRMKIRDIIAEGIDIHKLAKTKEEREAKVKELIDLVGLNEDHLSTKSLLSAIPEPDPERERKRQHLIYDSSIENDGESRQMYEIRPGHFVYATEAEAKNYKEEAKAN